jgi:Flp pilus assembly pilin Flp
MVFKNKKAQTMAEYAILLALVVAALIAMRTYVARGLQARLKGATDQLATSTPELGEVTQYEPYYLESQYDITSKSKQRESYSRGGEVTRTIGEGEEETRRSAGGYQKIKGTEEAD